MTVKSTISIFGARHPYGCTSSWERDGTEADCDTLLRAGDTVTENGERFKVTGFRDGKAVVKPA